MDKVSKIFLLDFKGGITFHKYGKISKKIIVGYQLDQLHKIVDYVYKENKIRMNFLKDKGLEKYETDPIFLIFDEWAEVVESCPKKELDKNGYLLFQQTLQKIESLGQLEEAKMPSWSYRPNVGERKSYLPNYGGIYKVVFC